MYTTLWKITVHDDSLGQVFCDTTNPEEYGFKTLGQLVDYVSKYAVNAVDKITIEYAGHTE